MSEAPAEEDILTLGERTPRRGCRHYTRGARACAAKSEIAPAEEAEIVG